MYYSLTSFCKYLPRFLRRNLNQTPESISCEWENDFPENDFIKAKSTAENQKPLQQLSQNNNGQANITSRRVTGIGPTLKMTQPVYLEILHNLVEQPFRREKAGLLLGPTNEDDLVTHYVPDTNGRATWSSFTLDTVNLNSTLRQHKEVGLNCKGIVHVHPPGVLRPSLGDLFYVAKLFANPKNKQATQVMLPIICNGRLYPYLIDADDPQEILVPNLILV